MGRRRSAPPEEPREAVEALLADPRVVWFPIRHYSPVCAWQLERVLREVQPRAVLVEGPEDATALIPHIVATDTVPPITVLSSYVDHKNRFGLNGVLSPRPEIPARMRAWWPLVPYAPEYVALKVGAELGAELSFIDAPLAATIPFTHGGPHARRSRPVDDRHLLESQWFDALGAAGRARSFEEFWQGRFEVGGLGADPDAFRRAVLLFAWCTRNLEGAEAALEADGTLLRERHMRSCIDAVLKAHPDGPIVVVVGAYHAVALASTKGKRAGRADRNTETLVCAHSYRALAKLYDMNRHPAWGDAVWRHLGGGEGAFLRACEELLVEVVRTGRDHGLLASTPDAVGASVAAQHLARLRGHREPTRFDLVDAAEMTTVKTGESAAIVQVIQQVLVGGAVGSVTEAAGQVPLIADFQAQAKRLRIDVSGASKVVRCDIQRQERHRDKSVFLHRCAWLELPMFDPLDDRTSRERGAFYRGPDVVSGDDLHLITETWGIRWTESVDDRLLELSDLGPTVGAAAAARLEAELAGAGADAELAGKLLLRCAQMGLSALVGRALVVLRAALATDGVFVHLVSALRDLALLHSTRDALVTAGDPRLVDVLPEVYLRACLALPSTAHVGDDELPDVLHGMMSLLSLVLTSEQELDRELLAERAWDLADGPHDAAQGVRGAAYGVLLSLGAAREAAVGRALDGLTRGSTETVLQTGRFLEGLFMTCRGVFLRSEALIAVVDEALRRVDWETFKVLLPDLRRAFTRFIPSEIDTIAGRVGETLEARAATPAVSPALVELGRRVDGRAAAALARHSLTTTG